MTARDTWRLSQEIPGMREACVRLACCLGLLLLFGARIVYAQTSGGSAETWLAHPITLSDLVAVGAIAAQALWSYRDVQYLKRQLSRLEEALPETYLRKDVAEERFKTLFRQREERDR